MKLTLTALTVAATMFASSASAFDPADLQKLRDTNKCVECDLSDLSEANLWGANLIAANLWGANLSNANLNGANLGAAELSNANLNGAELLGTYMKGVILCNTTMPDGSVIYSGC